MGRAIQNLIEIQKSDYLLVQDKRTEQENQGRTTIYILILIVLRHTPLLLILTLTFHAFRSV